MIENINIDGQNVSAELHALMYDYLYGYDGVFNYGKKLSHEVISNNEIRINDGLIISQGRFMRIVTGSYESIAIENGTSGVNRCDLIVAHFETDGINETYDIRVIKGTGASEPSYRTGDTFNGATVHEMPLYAVHIEGLNIASVEQKFSLIDSVNYNVERLEQLSNPNLLINSDFRNPVNQRGKTTYTNNGSSSREYTIDRWWISYGCEVTLENDGIRITNNTSENRTFNQSFENKIKLNNGITTSCQVEELNGSVTLVLNGSTMYTQALTVGENVLTKQSDSDYINSFYFYIKPNSSIKLSLAKLEQGMIATPFVPRLYGEELALCQRYYFALEGITGIYLTGNSSNSLYSTSFNFPVKMRVAPTVTVTQVSDKDTVGLTGITFGTILTYTDCISYFKLSRNIGNDGYISFTADAEIR